MRPEWTRQWLEWIGAAVLVAGIAVGGGACAQLLSALFPEGVPGYDTAPGVTVQSRSRPAFDPLGIRAGPFLLWPRLEESIGYDDNVLGSAVRRGSWSAGTRASMLAGSDWSRDAVGAYVSLSDTRYPGLPAQGRTDATVSVGGSLDIGRDRLTLAAAHLEQHQDRTQIDAVASDRPVAFRVDDARVSYTAGFGRWSVTPNLEASAWRFANTTILGVPVSQAYRDRTVLLGGVTLRYEWAPLRNIVFVTRALGQQYGHLQPLQRSTDSTGYQVLGGFDYDDDSVWRYRLLLGGESRQFAAFRPHTAMIAEAEATWTPTGMTTLRGVVTRSVEDAAQEGVAGFTYTAAKLTIDHEYLRNVLLSASAGLQAAEFLQGGGSQSGYRAGAGITWLVNRSVRLSATYDATWVRGARLPGSAGAGDYGRNLALLTLRLGM